MLQVVRLATKFGPFIIFTNLIIVVFLIYSSHLGIAETLGNFLLFLTFFVLLLRKSSTQSEKSIQHQFSNRFYFLFYSGIIIAGLLVFRAIFSAGPAVWGDAPYFYPETFRVFFSEPFVWESRGRLGVVNDLYWIYPLMFIYNGLGTLTGVSNDLVIRLVFYFPAIFLSFISPWFLTKYFGFSPLVRMFSVITYALSTYFILIVDGGQVGVVLAYGLFPLALLQLHKLMALGTVKQFFASLGFFMLLIISDVRFAAIAIFTLISWFGFDHFTSSRKIKIQKLKPLFYLLFISFLLSIYWVVPAFSIEATTGSGIRSDLKLISILNAIFIFSPHWPFNEFGKIFPPPWYFAVIPLLIFSNIFFKKTKYSFILLSNFLFFAYLVKGETGFLGGIYAWVVDTLPLGGAFRDSTKFFAPLLLFSGILIGLSVENLAGVFKKKLFSKLIVCFVFTYLLILIYPAITGKMHGVLSGREFPGEMQVIADKVSSEKEFLRTVWVPERHPLGFNSEGKPALDAKTLIHLRPFASLNVGDSDLFNFLHNKQFLQWMDIFGVKYLIFSGDTRRVLPDLEKDKDWSNLLNLASNIEGLNRVNWDLNLPIYQTKSYKPRFFAVDKVFAVIGGDDIYQKLIDSNEKFSIGNQGFIFFEDGKFNPGSLQNVSSDSLVIMFNQKEEKDLIFSFLSEFFQTPMNAEKSQWALRGTGEYLKWKYELLVNGIPTHEFDYGKGIAFSSQPNEELIFKLKVLRESEYILALRYMSASGSGALRVSMLGLEEEIPKNASGRFNWYIKQVKLNEGSFDLTVKNTGGFQVVNTAALIPAADWENAGNLTNELLAKFQKENNIIELASLGSRDEVSYKMISPVEYDVDTLKNSWLIFSDNYHPGWSLKLEGEEMDVFPVYSAVNGFYVNKSGNKPAKVFFKEQDRLRIALSFSLASLSMLAVVSFWIYHIKRRKKSV